MFKGSIGTLCFSGHRKLGGVYMTPQTHPHIYNKILELIYRAHLIGINEIVSGGALGLDTMAALATIQLQHSYPDIYLGIARPFPGFDSKWMPASRKLLADLMAAARWVHDVHGVAAKNYQEAVKMLNDRNIWMSNNSSHAVAFWQPHSTGGTFNFIKYRRASGKLLKIIEIPHINERGWERNGVEEPEEQWRQA